MTETSPPRGNSSDVVSFYQATPELRPHGSSIQGHRILVTEGMPSSNKVWKYRILGAGLSTQAKGEEEQMREWEKKLNLCEYEVSSSEQESHQGIRVGYYCFPSNTQHFPVQATSNEGQAPAREPTNLEEALMDLWHGVRREAQEEGEPEPSEALMAIAEKMLRAVYQVDQRFYYVYFGAFGDIAIDATVPRGNKLVIFCNADESVRCVVYENGQLESKEYSEPSMIPDEFVRAALHRLRA